MDHDLGAFFPVRPGSDRTMYNALKGPLTPTKIFRHNILAHEVAIATATPGWEPLDWAIVMSWGPNFQRVLDHLPPPDPELVQQNLATVTLQDGMDWLLTILARNKFYTGLVPVWTRRALRETRHIHNYTNKDLQKHLGAMSYASVCKWVGDKR